MFNDVSMAHLEKRVSVLFSVFWSCTVYTACYVSLLDGMSGLMHDYTKQSFTNNCALVSFVPPAPLKSCPFE